MSAIRHRPAKSAVVIDLPAGARIDRHMHANHQLVYMSSGAAEVRTDAGSWIAPPDRVVWIPAGCPHEHRFHGPTVFHAMGSRSNLVPGRTTPLVITATPLARELIITCSASDLPGAELGRMRQVLLDQLRRCPEQPLRLPAAADPRLRQVCALVAADLTMVWTLAALGRRVGVAERTLTRLFRTEFAMSYPQWRTQLRVHHATQLLAEGESVTAVAHRCGWATPSAFIDVYRRTLGHTPGNRRTPHLPTGPD